MPHRIACTLAGGRTGALREGAPRLTLPLLPLRVTAPVVEAVAEGLDLAFPLPDEAPESQKFKICEKLRKMVIFQFEKNVPKIW